MAKMLPDWLSKTLRIIAFSSFILFLSYIIDFSAEMIQDYRIEKDYITKITYRIDSLQEQNEMQQMQIQTLIKQDSFFDKELTYAFD